MGGSDEQVVKAPEQEPSGALDRRVKPEPSGNTGEFWHKLGCCVVEKPQLKKRRRINRTMIGEPMNFVHLTHIGSGEMEAGDGLAMTGAVQEQMRSKGNRDRPWSNSRGL
ncbi:PREDICTED: CDC42 small effector protein 1 [Myotis brandtii]|uniref:CDC42 small effector protein 1 n=1 Tax=Myotis brandtii TaxID=109478 RepID=UPI0003BBCF40|nr:PREDICTED: CDC42 small effector protein 1 [Myotis brandtii]